MISVAGLTKFYPPDTLALNDVNFKVEKGEFVAVIGSSGAGKSTLLRCINRLIEPSRGHVSLDGEEVTAASPRELRRIRRRMGMIFQQFHLVGRLSVLENVLTGRLGYRRPWASILGLFPREDREAALARLRLVDLEHLAHRRADTLSGGEQQRVGIARALSQDPEVILADEPTASLDPHLTSIIMGTLARVNVELGITVLVSQHQVEVAQRYASRVLGMRHGRIVFDGSCAQLTANITDQIYESNSRGS